MAKGCKNPNGSFLWSGADKEKLRDLYHEGCTDEEIAEELNRTVVAVQAMRCSMKLKKKHRPLREFRIHGAMADYYPKWYKDYLKKKWQQRLISTK